MTAMTLRCAECGKITLKLNAEKKCEECARKENEYLKHYVVKLDFVNPYYAK